MIPGILFATWRIFQILTLIPALGMLAYFVDLYTKANALTPTAILVLFIVVVLAAFWALFTLLAYGTTKHNANFVALVDLLFVGALIAGVYYLRGIAKQDCAQWGTRQSSFAIGLGILGDVNGNVRNPFSVDVDKSCAMLKASWAFGIMNIIFFFVTFLILLLVYRKHGNVDYHHPASRTHRHRSRSPRHYSSHSPRRSHHSSRSYTTRTRTYV